MFVGLVVDGGAGELGPETLNGRDDDLADGIDTTRPKELDVVEFGEPPPVTGSGKVLEFPESLTAKVSAVDKEEDPASPGVLEKPVDLVDGEVGFSRAGGHLDEGARSVRGE